MIRSLPNIHDIYSDAVDSIRPTGTITNSVETSGVYTLTTDNSLKQYEYITINDIDYRVNNANSTEIQIKTDTGLDFTGDTWKSKAPYFMHEKEKKANLVLAERDKDQILKYQKYPLVLFLHPYDVDETQYEYGIAQNVRVAFLNLTKDTYHSDDRYDVNFDPILKPIYEQTMDALLKDSRLTFEDSHVPRTRTDNLYIDNNPLPDELDGLMVTHGDIPILYEDNC